MRFFRAVLYSILLVSAFGQLRAYSQGPTAMITSVDCSRNPATITFNLVGAAEEEYEIDLYIMLEGDQASKVRLQRVTGDVGEGKFAGVGRRIQWDMTEMKYTREGARYQFAVDIRKASGGGIPWYVYPAAAAAGVAVYIAAKKPPSQPESVAKSIPVPPDRP